MTEPVTMTPEHYEAFMTEQRAHWRLLEANAMDELRTRKEAQEHQAKLLEQSVELQIAAERGANERHISNQRDYFAGHALAGILAGGFADTVPHDDINGGADAASFAYSYADAMMSERVRKAVCK